MSKTFPQKPSYDFGIMSSKKEDSVGAGPQNVFVNLGSTFTLQLLVSSSQQALQSFAVML